MSKKKHNAEHVNHERWLVSYADFITLLFAFFVVLFSSSQVDSAKSKKMALAIEASFNRFAIFKEMPGDAMSSESGGGSGGNAMKFKEYLISEDADKIVIVPPEIEGGEEETSSPPLAKTDPGANSGFISTEEQALAYAQKDITKLIEKLKLNSAVGVKIDRRGLVITINEVAMFKSGDEDLTEKSIELLDGIGAVLEKIPSPVRIEGHTDDQKPSGRFETNWDLSVARATFVLKTLLSQRRMNPARFSALGYGEYKPVASNATEEGRQKNRRVDIVLVNADEGKEGGVPSEPAPKEPLPAYEPIQEVEPPVKFPKFKNKKEDAENPLKKAIEDSYKSSYDPNAGGVQKSYPGLRPGGQELQEN